jgi:hypothetical protein
MTPAPSVSFESESDQMVAFLGLRSRIAQMAATADVVFGWLLWLETCACAVRYFFPIFSRQKLQILSFWHLAQTSLLQILHLVASVKNPPKSLPHTSHF